MPTRSPDRSSPRRFTSPLRSRLEHLEDRVVPANSLSVGDATLVEGNSGNADMVFTITRTGDLSASLKVGYSTADGTAHSGVDYSPRSGTVTFAAGVASAEVRVPVIGDLLAESNETFTLSLTGPIVGSGAPFTLAPRQTAATQVAPVAIATADLNADGKPDLLVTNRDNGSVSVYLNTTPTGSATVTFATRLDIGTGSEAHAVAAGDLNGDGKPDVAVANRNSGTVTVLLNTTPAGGATASFAVGVTFNTPSPQSVTIGDVNADGKPDLVLGSPTAGYVTVFLNTTPTGGTLATFTADQNFSTGGSPVRVLLADVNGDGRPDIVSGNQTGSGGKLAVHLNNTTAGSATVTLATAQLFGVVQPGDMMVGDLNGDGKPDFVSSGDSAISVLLNTTATGSATVTTATRQDFAGGVTPAGMAIADLDGDGKPDVVVANRNTGYSTVPADNTISLFHNETPTGATQVTFSLREDAPAGAGAIDAVAADMNGDGVLDLAVADRYDNTLSVFLQGNFTVIDGGGVGTITDDDRPSQDVTARSSSTGAWVVLSSTGSAFTSQTFGAWNPLAGWRDVVSGDFNGDGKADIAGRTSDGHWWVGLNSGTAFTTTHWAGWNEAAGWRDVGVGDFNGDGKADIAGRTSDGHWWVGLSTGTAFTTTHWAGWNEAAGWKDVRFADFNGDSKADIAGRTSDGHWWVGLSTGSALTTTHWAGWNEAAGWRDVSVGDFNGDGKADIAGRTADGHWWVGTSSGIAFSSTHFGGWNEAAGWHDVKIADFNGDGKADISGRDAAGNWWVSTSNGSGFAGTTVWAHWNEAAGWQNVQAGDFNGDGKMDIAGCTADGHWWVGISDGTAFSTTHWGAFPVGGPYVDVRGGYFAT